jgi:hypothetical protein
MRTLLLTFYNGENKMATAELVVQEDDVNLSSQLIAGFNQN